MFHEALQELKDTLYPWETHYDIDAIADEVIGSYPDYALLDPLSTEFRQSVIRHELPIHAGSIDTSLTNPHSGYLPRH